MHILDCSFYINLSIGVLDLMDLRFPSLAGLVQPYAVRGSNYGWLK